jgi:putative peptide zinc metalloprotease protein
MDLDDISFGADEYVDVRTFTRQRKGDELIIGLPGARSFIALPATAVEILDQLAAGRTVGEASSFYKAKYDETPALEELLTELAARGFVRRIGRGEERDAEIENPARSYLSFMSQRAASAIFSRPILGAASVLVFLAFIALVTDPSLLPRPKNIYFTDHRTRYLLFLVLWNYAAVFVHETAHLVAARAVGVNAAFGIGSRLWILVVETDLTGLWALPKRQRFLPLLAGVMVDTVCLSLGLLLLELQHRSVLPMPALAVELIGAVSFSYLMRLLWQCFLFVRTDFYYVFASLCGCTNLMQDTEIYLRYLLARALPWIDERERPVIRLSELRIVQLYAPLWVGGRILALLSLFLISLPLMARYMKDIVSALAGGTAAERADGLGVLVLTVLMLGPMLWGLGLWILSLSRKEATR